jgi:apolipoprotein N-acyltransferase
MILQQTLDMQNIFAYVLLSVTFGGLAGAFYALELKAAFTLFMTGLIVGFFSMYWQFIAGMDGWGDLTGVLSLFIYAGIGLAAGLVAQLAWYIIQKVRRGHRRR